MKKKLALLLAVVMVLGAVMPMNLMANVARARIFEGNVASWSNRTILMDDTLGARAADIRNIPTNIVTTGNDPRQGPLTGDGSHAIMANAGRGLDLVIELRNVADDDETFIRLENAKWAFAYNLPRTDTGNSGMTFPATFRIEGSVNAVVDRPVRPGGGLNNFDVLDSFAHGPGRVATRIQTVGSPGALGATVNIFNNLAGLTETQLLRIIHIMLSQGTGTAIVSAWNSFTLTPGTVDIIAHLKELPINQTFADNVVNLGLISVPPGEGTAAEPATPILIEELNAIRELIPVFLIEASARQRGISAAALASARGFPADLTVTGFDAASQTLYVDDLIGVVPVLNLPEGLGSVASLNLGTLFAATNNVLDVLAASTGTLTPGAIGMNTDNITVLLTEFRNQWHAGTPGIGLFMNRVSERLSSELGFSSTMHYNNLVLAIDSIQNAVDNTSLTTGGNIQAVGSPTDLLNVGRVVEFLQMVRAEANASWTINTNATAGQVSLQLAEVLRAPDNSLLRWALMLANNLWTTPMFIRPGVLGGTATGYFAEPTYQRYRQSVSAEAAQFMIGYELDILHRRGNVPEPHEARVTLQIPDEFRPYMVPGRDGIARLPHAFIVVPLVMMPTSDTAPIIVSNTTGGDHWWGSHPIANRDDVYGRTSSVFREVVDASRGRVYLPWLDITEHSANILRDGWFAFIPPQGFNMRWHSTPANQGPWVSHGSSSLLGTVINNPRLFAFYEGTVDPSSDQGNRQDLRRDALALWLDVPDAAYRTHAGTIRIQGLMLQAIEQDAHLYLGEGETLNVNIINWEDFTHPRPGRGRTRHIVQSDWYNDTRAVGTDLMSLAENEETARTENRTPGTTAQRADNYTAGRMSHETRLTNEAIPAIVRGDWHILFDREADNPTQNWSGRLDQLTARVSVEATTANAWVVNRDTTFTVVDADGNVLEDVKITRVIVHDTTRGLQIAGSNEALAPSGNPRTFWNRGINPADGEDAQNFDTSPNQWAHAAFSRDGHMFLLRDLASGATHDDIAAANRFPRVEMSFRLSAHPNFEGPVYIQIGGGGIEDSFNVTRVNNTRVHVANFARPFIVEATTNYVEIGYLIWPVSDIVMRENIFPFGSEDVAVSPRPLQARDVVTLEVGAFGRTSIRQGRFMGFNPIQRADVSHNQDGGFHISEVFATTDTGQLRFVVGRGSTGPEGAVITLSNLTLDIDRNIPEGNYDLVIGIDGRERGGENAFTWNGVTTLDSQTPQFWLYDRFNVSGMTLIDPVDNRSSMPYVVMRTAGAAGHDRGRVSNVRVGMNSFEAIVDGQLIMMEAPTILRDDRLFVPIRFVSQILGVDDRDIIWDPGLRQVTIRATNGSTVIFVENERYFFVDGNRHSTGEYSWDGSGVVFAPPFISDEWDRMFIPFRFLGNAFGIPVEWDDNAREAVFNPDPGFFEHIGNVPAGWSHEDVYNYGNNNGNNGE